MRRQALFVVPITWKKTYWWRSFRHGPSFCDIFLRNFVPQYPAVPNLEIFLVLNFMNTSAQYMGSGSVADEYEVNKNSMFQHPGNVLIRRKSPEKHCNH